jgi:hypothetical protein
MPTLTDRNKSIIEDLNKGSSSMSKLAKLYGVSKQRISEIYHRAIGQKQGYYFNQKRVIGQQAKEKQLSQVKFNCVACGIPVTYREAGRRSKYCAMCHKQSQYGQKDMNITIPCRECSKQFHPYRSKRTLNNYCSRECFHKSRIKDKFEYAQKMAAKRG